MSALRGVWASALILSGAVLAGTTRVTPLVSQQAVNAARDASAPVPPPALFGFFGSPATTQLARFDFAGLSAVEPYAPIREYHWHAAMSPNGSHVAAAIGSPSIGSVRIVDLATMEFVTAKAGIAVEALEWIDEDRIAASMDCVPANSVGRGCGIVVINARSGEIVRRWPETEDDTQSLAFEPPLDPPKPVAATTFGVVFVLSHVTGQGGALLALVTPSEELRVLRLDRIQVGRPGGRRTAAGLAMHPSGERAYVIGAEPLVAEIDLAKWSVVYHDVSALSAVRAQGFLRSALWFGSQYIATFGETVSVVGGNYSRTPDGVHLIDTRTWQAQTVEARASRALATGRGGPVVHGGGFESIMGVLPGGSQWVLAPDEARKLGAILSVHAGADEVFVVSQDGTDSRPRISAIDVTTGTVRASRYRNERLIDLLSTPHPR